MVVVAKCGHVGAISMGVDGDCSSFHDAVYTVLLASRRVWRELPS